jgi:hypothetical protein
MWSGALLGWVSLIRYNLLFTLLNLLVLSCCLPHCCRQVA